MDIQLRRVHQMLAKNEVTLDVPENVKDWLAIRGYDPVYGARPLKRVIQQNITNKLASLLISRDEVGPVHFEATINKAQDRIDFAEVVEDAEAWAEGD